MKTGFAIFLFIVLWMSACSKRNDYLLSDYKVEYSGLLDSILPFFAKLHDSIPPTNRFRKENKVFMDVHKKERDYEWMHYAVSEDGYSYFMISRLEPSIKKDKYLAICGRFRRKKGGEFDSASYEELFWTYKMKKNELKQKGLLLFRTLVETGNVDKYLPGKNEEYWIINPDAHSYYDKASQTWKTR